MSATSAGATVARSMSLRDGFARTRLAWLSGQVSDDMVRVITTGIPLALRRLNVAEGPAVVEQLEAALVPYAVEHSIAEVQAKLKRLRIAVDADGVDERSLAAYDEQQLTLVPVGDGYEVRGYLTKESAAVLLTCLDQTGRRLVPRRVAHPGAAGARAATTCSRPAAAGCAAHACTPSP